ncbi:MAG: sigma-70 family RNA polymerase sigma factor [Lentisphaeria bacterium]|nr:sigma-70 family RNA polymerase sigma factor [Lentisphaeria bacterium]MBO5765394.1 sigma-70 family RNA polymerase sigma factor [Lentisphaeria bacterium]MBO5900635.1 sigma-70 family RNA polymerase sigma factor [Lentisphaeria bacterium]MBO5990059.1 sigma-70 family RNA polymerase sigma factor [Lentisphaeria bacterium]MBO7152597.1 sigma-70 family RNA polymerase sigma factor [Lentisphaeria bacterium]
MENKKSAEQNSCENDVLIEQNLRLVLKIANDFLGRGLPWDDLVSEGNRGLMSAARKFDPKRGTKFSTYSAWWIKQAIRQAIAEQTQAVRVPIGTQLNSRRIRRGVKLYFEEFGREPDDDELAAYTNLPLATIKRLRNTRQADMQSLNANVLSDDEDGSEFQEFLSDNDTAAPDENLLRIEDIDQLLKLLDRLPERERMVLRLRFGLDGSPVLTLEEVGKQLNCTNERIRQIQILALKKLHAMMTEE